MMTKTRFLMLCLLPLEVLAGCGDGTARYSTNPQLEGAYRAGEYNSKAGYAAFKRWQAWEVVYRTAYEAHIQGYSGNSCAEYADGTISCRLVRLQRPIGEPSLKERADFEIAYAFNEGVRRYLGFRYYEAVRDAYQCGEALCLRRPTSAKLKGFEIRERSGEVTTFPLPSSYY